MIEQIKTALGYLLDSNRKWKFEIDAYRIQYDALCGDQKAAAKLATMIDEKTKILPVGSLYTKQRALDTLGEEVKRRLGYGMTAGDTIAWLESIRNISDLLQARETKLSDLQHGKT